MPLGYPSYLDQVNQGQLCGQSIADVDARQAAMEQQYDPELARAQKKEAMAAARSYEMTQIAQSLEHMRQRLISLDCLDHAKTLNLMIISIVQQWTEERVRQL